MYAKLVSILDCSSTLASPAGRRQTPTAKSYALGSALVHQKQWVAYSDCLLALEQILHPARLTKEKGI
jgi:hypothetical protein